MSSKNGKTYKCPFCEKRYTRDKLVNHIDAKHEESVPEGFSTFRFVFHYVNKRPLTYHGICTECKGPTDWDEERGRYKRQCNKKACHDSYVKKFEENMIRTKGTKRISSTKEGQIKMLQNRKISGTYTFSNGVKRGYTGSYEKKALEFMDLVLHIDPNDLMSPGPILEYTYKGQTHFYITDFYYQPYNLVIEVKDGGSNPNNRDMPEYRAKQIEKEKFIVKHTNYNYLRLTDNDFKQLMIAFAQLKFQMNENTGERVININESSVEEMMSAVSFGPVIGMEGDKNVYIRNYMSNNTFSGEDPNEEYKRHKKKKQKIAVSEHYTFDTFYTVENGTLQYKQKDIMSDDEWRDEVVCITNPHSVTDLIKKSVGKEVSESFLYDTIFGKKLYCADQIYTEENTIIIPCYEKAIQILESVVKNYILKDTFLVSFEEGYMENIIEETSTIITGNNENIISETFGLDEKIVKNFINLLGRNNSRGRI